MPRPEGQENVCPAKVSRFWCKWRREASRDVIIAWLMKILPSHQNFTDLYIIIELSAPEYLYTNLRMYLLDVLDC